MAIDLAPPGDGGAAAEAISSTPSFAAILGARKPPKVDLSPTDHLSFRKDGKPAIAFSPDDYERGIDYMKCAVVMKFSGSHRPTLTDIRENISRDWGIAGEFSLGTIDRRHVLLRFENKSEVSKALSRVGNQIKGSCFRIFRWRPGFDLSMDPCFAPIWVELPNLPLEFYHPALLGTIGDHLGTFLNIDQGTLFQTNPQAARICVEMNITDDFPDEVWIEAPKIDGFWQSAVYPNFSYCTYCSILGHTLENCRKRPQYKKSDGKLTSVVNEVDPEKIIPIPDDKKKGPILKPKVKQTLRLVSKSDHQSGASSENLIVVNGSHVHGDQKLSNSVMEVEDQSNQEANLIEDMPPSVSSPMVFNDQISSDPLEYICLVNKESSEEKNPMDASELTVKIPASISSPVILEGNFAMDTLNMEALVNKATSIYRDNSHKECRELENLSKDSMHAIPNKEMSQIGQIVTNQSLAEVATPSKPDGTSEFTNVRLVSPSAQKEVDPVFSSLKEMTEIKRDLSNLVPTNLLGSVKNLTPGKFRSFLKTPALKQLIKSYGEELVSHVINQVVKDNNRSKSRRKSSFPKRSPINDDPAKTYQEMVPSLCNMVKTPRARKDYSDLPKGMTTRSQATMNYTAVNFDPSGLFVDLSQYHDDFSTIGD